MHTTSTTNDSLLRAQALQLAADEAPIFIDLHEAGRLAGGHDYRWVEKHVAAHRAFGAPPILEIRTTPDSVRCAARLIEREAWIQWLRSRTAPSPVTVHGAQAATIAVPVGLQSPGKRAAYARSRTR